MFIRRLCESAAGRVKVAKLPASVSQSLFVVVFFRLWKCAKEVAWKRSEKWRKVHIACVGLITKREQALAPVQHFSLEVGCPNHADGIQQYLIGWSGFEQYFEILKYCSWTVSWSSLCILYKAMHLTVIYKAHWTPPMCHRSKEAVTIVTTSVMTQTHTSHSHCKTVSVLVRFQTSDCRGLAGLGCYSCGAHVPTISCALKHFKSLICKRCLLSQNQNECMKNNYVSLFTKKFIYNDGS